MTTKTMKANRKFIPAGLLIRHCRILGDAIASFLRCDNDGSFGHKSGEYDVKRWAAWATSIATGTATENEWEAARYLIGVPYTQPEYIDDVNNCERYIFALWVLNGTRFGQPSYDTRPDPAHQKVTETIATINGLIGE